MCSTSHAFGKNMTGFSKEETITQDDQTIVRKTSVLSQQEDFQIHLVQEVVYKKKAFMCATIPLFTEFCYDVTSPCCPASQK